MTRIEWSRDGGELLTCRAGVVRRHDARGAVLATIAEAGAFDARYAAMSIVIVDDAGTVREYTDGALARESARPWVKWFDSLSSVQSRVYAAALDAAAGRLAALTPEASIDVCAVLSIDANELDVRTAYRYDIAPVPSRSRVELSASGARVAMSYETRPSGRLGGRGILVIDTDTAKVVQRTYKQMQLVSGPCLLAFDRAGKRLAFASPEADGLTGVIRLDREGPYPLAGPGGARAVTLDDRGILAAYAYRDRDKRLRVDYLSRYVRGAPVVEIADTLWIDPDAGDVIALAFAPDSRSIACLDASGAIDVVPVP